MQHLYKSCPFDNNHRIEESKFAKHLKKCKAASRADFQVCRYNQQHWVNFTQLKEHEENCPNKFKSVSQSINEAKNHSEENCIVSKKQQKGLISRIEFHEHNESYEDLQEFTKEFEKIAIKESISNKTIDHREMKKNNYEPLLWQEPDFNEWLDEYMKKKKIKPKTKNRNHEVDQSFQMKDNEESIEYREEEEF